MKAKIEVLQPGLFSTIQDLGRFEFQKFGVPQSGVMDRYAMRMCNLILGNEQDASVLEITMQGPQLRFEAPAKICISGADLSPKLNDQAVSLYSPLEIQAGDILKFGSRKSGFRTYLGISGGFQTETLMNSKSWYEGITKEFRLSKSSELFFEPTEGANRNLFSSIKIDSDYLISGEIEVYPGPEFERLNSTQKQQLFNSPFKTDESSNRMAVQLKQKLHNELDSIITAPVIPGTVQLTPSGDIIILMRDCQTTGGYPRILQLSEKGIQVLSQKLPGEAITLVKKDYKAG